VRATVFSRSHGLTLDLVSGAHHIHSGKIGQSMDQMDCKNM
jgi:hypothetical protein